MFVQLLSGIARPSKLLSGLALILCVVLQAPAFLLWPFLGAERRRDVLAMVQALISWATTLGEQRPERATRARSRSMAGRKSPPDISRLGTKKIDMG